MCVNTCLSVHAVWVTHQFFHDRGKQEATDVSEGEDVVGDGGEIFAEILCPSQNELTLSCCLHWFKHN